MYIEHIKCNSCGYPAPCTSPSCYTRERHTACWPRIIMVWCFISERWSVTRECWLCWSVSAVANIREREPLSLPAHVDQTQCVSSLSPHLAGQHATLWTRSGGQVTRWPGWPGWPGASSHCLTQFWLWGASPILMRCIYNNRKRL